MRAVFIKIRFSENGIALLFIKRSCLLLGVQADGVAARVSDLGFSSGKDPGTEMISAKFFFNGDSPDDIFALCLYGKNRHVAAGTWSMYRTRWMAVSSVSSNSS